MPTYLITWTTYGTWLHGDSRGSVSHHQSSPGQPLVTPSLPLLRHKQQLLRTSPVMLSESQRTLVDQTIRDHCDHRAWTLHAVNVRTNHVHVVCSALTPPERVMGEFKAWATRRLRDAGSVDDTIWTRHGSTRWINSPSSLERAIQYVRDQQ